MQYPTEIPTGLKVPTLGTVIPQQFQMQGVVPKAYIQNENIEIDSVQTQANALGFTAPLFQTTAEEYFTAARERDRSELQQQRMGGVPKTSYLEYTDTNSAPTNYNWSSTPMSNLQLSKNTVPYKYAETWPLADKQTRSDYRTQMGREIMAQSTALRSVRLY